MSLVLGVESGGFANVQMTIESSDVVHTVQEDMSGTPRCGLQWCAC